MKKRMSAFLAFAASFCAFAAVSVSTEAELNAKIAAGETDITLTASITSSADINIPAGVKVTLADNVTLTMYYKDGGKNGSDTVHYLKGAGTVVLGKKKIVTNEVRTIPVIGGDSNKFKGLTYEVTEVVSEGGTVSYSQSSQVSCALESQLSVDGGKTWVSLSSEPKAVVCNVSSGINGGRSFAAAYASFNDAYAAAKFTSYPFSNPPVVGNGKVVVLLEGGKASPSGDQKTIGLVVDCAGNSGEIGVELKSNSFVTLLNASTATSKQLTNSGVVYINCSTAKASGVNTNQDTYSGQVHIYDCGSVSLPSKFPSGGGAFFYCGGPYTMSFGTNYKVYGGTFKNDPTSYLASSDLETEKGSDGYWTVKDKTAAVNVAAIGETGYPTLQAAVDAATSGAKVALLADVALAAPVVVAQGKNLTIELAGFDITAETGALVNNGTLKLEDSSNYDEPSTLTTSSGDLIVNNGTLEVTYGTYTGDIVLNSGMFTVHHGEFNGELKVANGVSAQAVANLRGGKYKNSVSALLAGGYSEILHGGFYWVGVFPSVIVTDSSISGAEKAWHMKGLTDADRAIFVKSSTFRSDYTDAEWYRRAELKSMLEPYTGYTIDCVVRFDRGTKAETVRVYAATSLSINDELDRDLAAGEIYRVLSSKITDTQISYSRFLGEDTYKSITLGIKNLSGENAGTVCSIEFHLCHADRITKEIVTDFVISSITYRFPWADGDAIPELREDDSPETVASALEGTADAKVAENIKDVVAYNSYRAWTAGVKGATAAEVKSAPNAWLSYALNTTNLVATPVEGDLKVESLIPSASEAGSFKLELSLKDVDIGAGNASPGQVQENLSRIFGLEGATSLEDGAFSKNNVVYSFGAPVAGKVTVEARPAVTGGGSFFFRAKMAR